VISLEGKKKEYRRSMKRLGKIEGGTATHGQNYYETLPVALVPLSLWPLAVNAGRQGGEGRGASPENVKESL